MIPIEHNDEVFSEILNPPESTPIMETGVNIFDRFQSRLDIAASSDAYYCKVHHVEYIADVKDAAQYNAMRSIRRIFDGPQIL